jgi:hypothetical protein
MPEIVYRRLRVTEIFLGIDGKRITDHFEDLGKLIARDEHLPYDFSLACPHSDLDAFTSL